MQRRSLGRNAKERHDGGFTLLEVVVATVVFLALAAAFVAILSTTLNAYSEQQSRAALALDGARALAEIIEAIRETGRHTATVPVTRSYPYLFANGVASGYFAPHSHSAPSPHVSTSTALREIVFRRPTDLDDDGYITDGSTGRLEWGPLEFSYILEAASSDQNQLVRRTYDPQSGNFSSTVVLRHVDWIAFDDQTTDGTLGPDTIRVQLFLLAYDPKGNPIEYTCGATVAMRNTEEP